MLLNEATYILSVIVLLTKNSYVPLGSQGKLPTRFSRARIQCPPPLHFSSNGLLMVVIFSLIFCIFNYTSSTVRIIKIIQSKIVFENHRASIHTVQVGDFFTYPCNFV